MCGAIDNHCHILYGVDDGIATVEESLKTLSYMESKGISAVWLTPHTMEDVPNTTVGLKARFEELRDAYHGNIRLSLASEYMIDTLYVERLRAKDLLLHGEDRVLVETSTWSPPVDLWSIIEETLRSGYRPIMAHPERYRYMTEADYDKLRKMGVLMQLNIPSVLGVYGETAMSKAASLLEKGYYDMLGSDCHRYSSIERQCESKSLTADTVRQLQRLVLCGA